jgi:hypothetical protein
MAVISVGPATASTVAFDTFGPGDSYNPAIIYSLLPQANGSFGFVFEANASGRVEEITLGVRGNGNFRAELFAVDAGSLPDVSLGSWSGIAATTLSGFANLPRIIPLDGPILQSGSSYAIVIHSESPNTLGWYFARAYGTYKLPLVEFDAQGNWMATTLDAGAFRIIVPAPSALVAIGLCGLLTRRRRS